MKGMEMVHRQIKAIAFHGPSHVAGKVFFWLLGEDGN